MNLTMNSAVTSLPDDIDALRALCALQAKELARQSGQLQARDGLIDKLKEQLAVLRRTRFGKSSEKIERDIAQLELALDEIEAAEAELPFEAPAGRVEAPKTKPVRQPLPDHLPRHEIVHDLGERFCPCCGGRDFLKSGRGVTEVLDYVPASFRVLRHVQPRFVCKGCDNEITASMPSLPIERGKPDPGLVAHVLTAKYCDHLPLYRQSEIYAREGVELARSTLSLPILLCNSLTSASVGHRICLHGRTHPPCLRLPDVSTCSLGPDVPDTRCGIQRGCSLALKI